MAGHRNVTSENPGMHLLIYRTRPDVQAIVHAHPPTATGFAAAGMPLTEPLVCEVVMGLGCIPLARYGTPVFGYPNPYFWAKMALLLLVGVHALIFKPIVYDHPEELDKAPVIPTRAKVAAVLSLVLWVSIPLCGRLIGYYEPDEGKATQSVTNHRGCHQSVKKLPYLLILASVPGITVTPRSSASLVRRGLRRFEAHHPARQSRQVRMDEPSCALLSGCEGRFRRSH